MTTRSVSKMADINVSFRQRALIEFLVKEEQSAVDIHQRLQCANEMPAWVPAVLGDG
ncbi:hypothetical protein L9F63_004850 [Diploptera punctata]|uniref:Uncharacterized protein n=1 Tax=Diploptera punctata TaxID=6984 RepID=A0AAD7ZFS3_DIPPU|nr:hypothetical protein L9F63_004850 [Diploptera punctata]